MASVDGDAAAAAAFVSSPDMENYLCQLLNDSSQPISERFRALFSLRNLKGPSPRHALVRGNYLHSTPFSMFIITHMEQQFKWVFNASL